MRKKQKIAVKSAKEVNARNRSAEIPALHIQDLLNDGEIMLLGRR